MPRRKKNARIKAILKETTDCVVRLIESGDCFTIPADAFFRYVKQGYISPETERVGLIDARLLVAAQNPDGTLLFARKVQSHITAAIKSICSAWEREWFFDVRESEAELHQLRDKDGKPIESYLERVLRVRKEQEEQIFYDCLDWQSGRSEREKNSIRWVSREHLREVLVAFGREMADAN